MESDPEVREGEANERRCGENAPLSCQSARRRHETRSSVGGPRSVDMMHVQNQQGESPSTYHTTAIQGVELWAGDQQQLMSIRLVY